MNQKSGIALVTASRLTGRRLSQLLAESGLSVEVFESTRDFLSSPKREQAGCLVLDLRAPSAVNGGAGNGGPAIAHIPVPVVLFTPTAKRPVTAHGDLAVASDAAAAAAEDAVLLEAITAALEDSASARAGLLQGSEIADRLSLLTPREREVMDLVIDGLSNRRIASRCGISPRTVEIHRARVMEKMGARSLSELVRIACLQDMPTGRGPSEPEPLLHRVPVDTPQRRKA